MNLKMNAKTEIAAPEILMKMMKWITLSRISDYVPSDDGILTDCLKLKDE